MGPRYVIINEKERTKFEEKWQMPFGYGSCLIFDDFHIGMNVLSNNFGSGYVLEEYSNGNRKVVYKAGKEI